MMLKLLLAATGTAAALVFAFGSPPCDSEPLRGQYVEGRTASVFAGACHYGGEYTTRGREAVLAWHVDAGEAGGESLAGLTAVAVVAGEANLAERCTARESVVYLSAGASDAQRDAFVGWLEERHGAVLGSILRVERAPVAFERDGDAFTVRAGERVALSGSTLPDRACCKMPLSVWYEPFADVHDRVVGCAEDFRCDEDALDRRWTSSGENCVFVAGF